jgi:hypothetical protein
MSFLHVALYIPNMVRPSALFALNDPEFVDSKGLDS